MLHSLILQYLGLNEFFGLTVAFLGMIFEGDIFLFTFGFLTSLGFFKIENIFFTLFLGTIFGDILWYLLGNRIKKFPKWLNFIPKHFNSKIDSHLKQNTFRTIFVSKFIYGVHHLILVRAGMLKIDLRKFIKLDFVASFVWIIIISALGYLSGAYFELIKHYLRFTEVGLLIGLMVFLLFERIVRQSLNKKL